MTRFHRVGGPDDTSGARAPSWGRLRRNWRHFCLAAAVGLGLGGAAACAGPTLVVQQYAGPVRPPETISILRVNGREQVQLLALDGEDVAVPIASDSRLHIELLPGRHTVTVQNVLQRAQVEGVDFVAEAGKVYRVVFVAIPDREGALARMVEVDRGSDAVVRDVTTDRASSAGRTVPPRRSTLDVMGAPERAPSPSTSTPPAEPPPPAAPSLGDAAAD